MVKFLRNKKSAVKKTIISAVLVMFILSSLSAVLYAQGKDNVFENNHFADIAEKVDNGVVKVTSTVETTGSQELPPMFNDPYFRFFFGDRLPMPEQQPRERQGFGSGFIVSEDGYIVTNQHVINGADKIEVSINGIEEPLEAEIAWSDFGLDLAVLKIDTDADLTPIKIGNSEKIRPGDWAVAIGNPFGFEHTVTVGVISALGRPIQIPTNDRQVRTYQNLIQLDAAINPGNSGGPLLNINGEVIGINTAVSAAGQGIGFAIPINEIKGIVDQLKTEGQVTQPWLGIAFSEISKDMQDYFKLENREGVIVIEVYPDSPAEKAGLKPYDVIKEIDEKKIDSTSDVADIIQNKELNDRIMIKVIRNGSPEIIFARIGNKPSDINR